MRKSISLFGPPVLVLKLFFCGGESGAHCIILIVSVTHASEWEHVKWAYEQVEPGLKFNKINHYVHGRTVIKCNRPMF